MAEPIWSYEPDGLTWAVVDQYGKFVAGVNTEEDARLMAASRAMFAAIERELYFMVCDCADYEGETCSKCQMQAALAQAKGVQP